MPTDTSKSYPGVLHEYAPKLVTFEFATSPDVKQKPHSLLFIGGLGDGFGTVPYVVELAKALESTEWSLFSVLLSSSWGGWGLGSLDKDVEEIAECVRFVRDYKSSLYQTGSEAGKIVVMGHSTGSQDVLHYLHSPNPLPHPAGAPDTLQHLIRPELDGAILQGPVSDREYLLSVLKTGTEKCTPNEADGVYLQLLDFAKRQPYTFDGVDALLPLSLTAKLGYPPDAPISGRRFLSLASPGSPERPSEDDLFSSDLSDARLEETFGKIKERGLLRSRLMVLYSGKDECVPDWIDKEKLMQRWEVATSAERWDKDGSCVIPDATHTVSGVNEAPQQELLARVTGYLNRV